LLEIFVKLPVFQDHNFDIFGRDVSNKIRHKFTHLFYYYKFVQNLFSKKD